MMNHIDIMGRLTAAPQLRATASGTAVATIRVAVDRDTNSDETDFFDVVVWGKGAEFVCAYFDKGSMIGVSGRLRSREYTDRDGNKRSAVEINSERVYFAGNAKAEAKSGRDRDGGAGTYGPYGEDDGECPF